MVTSNIVIRWKLFYLYLAFLLLISVLPINGSASAINHVFIVTIRGDYLLHCLVYVPVVVLAWMDKEHNLNQNESICLGFGPFTFCGGKRMGAVLFALQGF
ncbi:MAG: hypothetical protein R2764_22290 [Bacteroidales bacterium]